MLKLGGRLVSKNTGGFARHQVECTYKALAAALDRKLPTTLQALKGRRVCAEVDVEGHFEFTLPFKKSLTGELTFTVRAPDGTALAERRYAAEALPERLEIKVEPKQYEAITPSPDAFRGRAAQLTGRVIDREGKVPASNLQVIVMARPADAGPNDFRALLQARTNVTGYFSAPWPRGKWAEAYGLVSVNGGEKVPIALEDGALPHAVMLIVALPREATPKAAQKPPRQPLPEDLVNAPEAFSQDLGGACVSFTVPNRTIEEYDAYFAVRTTDPEIGPTTRRTIPQAVKDFIVQHYGQLQFAEPGLRGNTPVAAATPDLGNATTVVTDRVDPSRLELKSVGTASTPGVSEADLAALDADVLAGELGRSAPSMSLAASRSYRRALRDMLAEETLGASGRRRVDFDTPVPWDSLGEPPVQARTVAHGHVLHFKQVWRADGYSLGDLLHSLPLAPCQKKQIAIVDWERRELARREEQMTYSESLEASLTRDRDISEIVNASLDENTQAYSDAYSASASASAGGGLLGVFSLGVSGGFSSAESSANQSAARDTVAAALQKIRDRTQQTASAVRSQRATVIQTLRQGETATVTTEVVANHNHCHAITIQYFEVLRHFAVSQELADVRECLFVPLIMSEFDGVKALRWRDLLSRHLLKRALRDNFEALRRVEENWQHDTDIPDGCLADETLEFVAGELRTRISLQRPRGPIDAELTQIADGKYKPTTTYIYSIWGPIAYVLGKDAQAMYEELSGDVALMDKLFQESVAPRLAEELVKGLRFHFITASGGWSSAPLNATLVSDYRYGDTLTVALNYTGAPCGLARARLQNLRISLDLETSVYIREITQAVPNTLLDPLNKLIVVGADVRYRTAHLNGTLFHGIAQNDQLSPDNDVHLFVGDLTRQEQRNPRQSDRDKAHALLDHLNSHVEYYHKVIWARMDADRRLMLLDGFEAPNARGRSLASVVENRLIGIAGNSLIFPVASGVRLDPTYKVDPKNPATLLDAYAPLTPPAPMRISVPTKGVFAEAVMGSCNSCETIDDTRFWRWDEAPCGDEPTAIQSPSTDTRWTPPPPTTPTAFPNPIINLQNAPQMPDPSGLQQAMSILGKADTFRDLTGLSGTQAAAMTALQQSGAAAGQAMQSAIAYAQSQALTKNRDVVLDTLRQARDQGGLSEDEYQRLTGRFAEKMIGVPDTPPPAMDSAAQERILQSISEAGSGEVTARTPDGTLFEASFQNGPGGEGNAGSGYTVELSNRYLDSDTEGLSDAQISLLDPDGAVLKQGSTDSKGNKAKIDIPADSGVYTLQVRARYNGAGNATSATPEYSPAPARVWRTFETTLSFDDQGALTCAHPDVKITGKEIHVGLQPVWIDAEKIDARMVRPRKQPISLIVVHHTAAEKDESAVRVWAKCHDLYLKHDLDGDGNNDPDIDPKTGLQKQECLSIHYFIDLVGNVVKYVHDESVANQAGEAYWKGKAKINDCSIGIEITHAGADEKTGRIEKPYRPEQYAALIVLLKDLTAKHGLSRAAVVGHSDIALHKGTQNLGNKAVDPGIKFDWPLLEREGIGLIPRSDPAPDLGVEYLGYFATYSEPLTNDDSDKALRYGGTKRTNVPVPGSSLRCKSNSRRLATRWT